MINEEITKVRFPTGSDFDIDKVLTLDWDVISLDGNVLILN